MIDLQKLDLRKKIVFDLTKSKGIENQKAQVILCMDYSGSMNTMYRDGYVQDIIERIVPVAMQFDDNQEIEFYLFSDEAMKHSSNVTLKNLDGFIKNEILTSSKYSMSGTNYAPPIKSITEDYAKFPKSSWAGLVKRNSAPLDLPVYVIFITDGENRDHSETKEALRDASKAGIFFQFIGIGAERFTFLQQLDTLSGRFIDNANFFPVRDLNKTTDEDLYNMLLGEFPDWLKLAKTNNLIK